MPLRVVWIEAVMTLLNEGTIFCVTGVRIPALLREKIDSTNWVLIQATCILLVTGNVDEVTETMVQDGH